MDCGRVGAEHGANPQVIRFWLSLILASVARKEHRAKTRSAEL